MQHQLMYIFLLMAFIFVFVSIWGIKKYDNKLIKDFDSKYRQSRRK